VIPSARTELRCMALELNEGGGKGREYPLCFFVDSFETDLVKDERRGGMSFGGMGGGEDIQWIWRATCLHLIL
jgi:hypothetical protein